MLYYIVLNNCVIDEIDIESLPLFDVEYLFDSGIIEVGTEFLKVDEDGK